MEKIKATFFVVLLSVSAYAQLDLLPSVAWKTIVTNVVMLTDSTYKFDVFPTDFNDKGIDRYGNYFQDYAGNKYKVIDSTFQSVTVWDEFKTGVSPSSNLIGVMYQTAFGGKANYAAPINYRGLDANALDNARAIELAEIWKSASGAVPDSIWSNINSSARLWGGIITANGNGTVAIGEGAGLIKEDNAHPESTPTSLNQGQGSRPTYVHWNSVPSLSLVDNAYNFIFFDGTDSIIKTTTDFYSISFTQDFTLGRAFRIGNDVIVRLCGTNAWNFNRRVQLFGEEVFPILIKKGSLKIGALPNRQFSITSGVLWAEGANRFSVGAYNGATTSFTAWYRDATTGFVRQSGQTQVSNLLYDDGSGTLSELLANRYGVHWVYVVHDGSVHVVYGQGNYTQTGAQTATLPDIIPPLLDAYATLVGKITIQKSATSFFEIISAFTEVFATSQVNNHNDLSGLQGGAAGDYQHLTTAEKIKLQDSVLVAMIYPTASGITTYNGTTWGTSITNSLGLSGAISDKTGSGVLMFGTSPAVTTSFTLNYATANQILATNASKQAVSLSTATYPSLTELSYIKGLSSAIQTQLNGKQATLVSGTNIKSINGNSILGSGDLTVSGMVYPGAGLPISTGSAWGTSITPATGYLSYSGTTYSFGALPSASTSAAGIVQIGSNSGLGIFSGGLVTNSNTLAPGTPALGDYIGFWDIAGSPYANPQSKATIADMLALSVKATLALTSSTAITLNYSDGGKGSVSLAHNTTLTITNLSDGGEGQIDINNTGAYSLTLAGSTGYTTTKAMGANSTLQSSVHNTLVYWRNGSTLYYGIIYAN